MSKAAWDEHWKRYAGKKSIFESLSSFFRIFVFAGYVARLTDRHFKRGGIYLEAGCGTGQSSLSLNRYNRRYIALDCSFYPLEEVRKNNHGIDLAIAGNILCLPFSNESFDGIWNVGVMEHFDETNLIKIYREFARVLKKNGTVIILIPPVYGPFHIAFTLLEKTMSLIKRKKFKLWPDMLTPFRGVKAMEKIFKECNMRIIDTDFSWRSCFIHNAIVAERCP